MQGGVLRLSLTFQYIYPKLTYLQNYVNILRAQYGKMLEGGKFMENYRISVDKNVVEINIPRSIERVYASILNCALDYDVVGMCVGSNERSECIDVFFLNELDKPKIENFVNTVMQIITKALSEKSTENMNMTDKTETTL